jgi:hypothetical protein
MSLFCKHNYDIVNSFVVRSEFDIVVESGYKPTSLTKMKRIHVTDLKCCKCNKFKRLKVRTA